MRGPFPDNKTFSNSRTTSRQLFGHQSGQGIEKAKALVYQYLTGIVSINLSGLWQFKLCTVSPKTATKKITKEVEKNLQRNENVTLKNIHLMAKKETKEEHRQKNTWDIQKTKSKMADVNPSISVTTLNINALDTQVKREGRK